MHDPLRFRRDLTTRILGLLGAASLTAMPAACTGGAAKATSDGTTTTKTTTAALTTTTFVDAGMGGAGGASGVGGAGGAGGALVNPPVQACFDWPPAGDAGIDADPDAGPAPGGCPMDPAVVLADFLALACPLGWEPYKIVSGPMTNASQQCCYLAYNVLCGPGGRPYLVDDRARVAAPQRGSGARGWADRRGSGEGPCLGSLSALERAALAEAWAADALLEHASVASFARFALALLAAGAPADLLEPAHQAALDEVHHARLCFALASAYAGEEITPGAFPLGREVHVGGLVSLAASTVTEGCVGETVAALVASAQLARATDPAVREALAQIAADEARHAELAWRTVAWAVRTGGSEVRAAVERALAQALAGTEAPPAATPSVSAAMEAHGRIDAATTAAVAASALAEVVAPAARLLLRRESAPARHAEPSRSL